MNKLTITISGPPRSGKTLFAKAIAFMCHRVGIKFAITEEGAEQQVDHYCYDSPGRSLRDMQNKPSVLIETKLTNN